MPSQPGDRPALSVEDVTLGYDGVTIVEALSQDWEAGLLHALIGANGSGKSTLLRALSSLLRPESGAVRIEGELLKRLPPRELARRLSILPQSLNAPDGLTVEELIEFGRHPYRKSFAGESVADREEVARAAAFVGVTNLMDRPLGTLSGGQRQLAWIAMTLAQQARVLLLDEPTTALDPGHQLDVLELLARLRDGGDHTIVVVLHDINLAARHADRMIGMKDGRIVAAGTPQEVMTPGVLGEIFDVDVEILRDPRHGAPQCVAYPRRPGHGSRMA